MMNAKESLKAVIAELGRHAELLDSEQLERLAEEIAMAPRVFASGAGRSGLMMRAFAMRLMHLGKTAHVLGDATVPRAREGDLLLLGSGSGETKSLIAAAEKAKALGMRIALCTIDAGSALARLADVAVVLPGASQKVNAGAEKAESIQPMGSSFEQLCLLCYDTAIMALMERLGQTGDGMFARHANIE
jgi:6-phospho-3-hexuloisomerase